LATAVYYLKLSMNARYVLVTQYSCSTWGDGMSLPTEQLGRANQESHHLSIHFQNFTPIQQSLHHLKNKKLLCSSHKNYFRAINILNTISKSSCRTWAYNFEHNYLLLINNDQNNSMLYIYSTVFL